MMVDVSLTQLQHAHLGLYRLQRIPETSDTHV